ncbi:MAG: VOC family protein [Vicinamibacterales bacterium]
MSIVNVTAFVAVLATASSALAQTPAPAAPRAAAAARPAAAASPVVFTHVHLTVKDVAATKKLLVEGLGGTAAAAGSVEGVKFPGLFVLLHPGEPKGGSKGSTVSLIGLEVRELAKMVEGLRASKAKLVTREETNMVYTVLADVATIPDRQTISAVVQTPDGVNIRLVENKKATAPVSFAYIHFAPANLVDTMDWYSKAFGAKTGNRGFGFQSLDLGKQASALMFTLASDTVVGTEGRSLARIGFEVRGAALLARKIQGLGGKIVTPAGKSPATGVTTVVVSDPWGTLIELTEGLKL